MWSLAAFFAAISLSIIGNIISTVDDFSVILFLYTFPLFLIAGTLTDAGLQKIRPVRPPFTLAVWILTGSAAGFMLSIPFVKPGEILHLTGWGAGSALLYASVLHVIRLLSLFLNESGG
ncbi:MULTISPECIES: hypothetical protein [Halobacillus]|uniref:hypothetical protein n=1 Tax=Halobacillus TaxID=45667 RepID=UPI00136ABE45|nr:MULTISPECIES: hypothetical protein [Halobacillus]MYL31195.1 hypothetical protein [Halobacillus halophilus]MYL39663.1 hypothetical protein [Halobacillus litoralis]